MMNKLTNKASPATTWLGGTVVRPIALRVIERTTKTFVKDVVSSSRAGATDSRVSAIRMTIDWLGLPLLPPTLTVTEPSGSAGAAGGGGAGGGGDRAWGAGGGG